MNGALSADTFPTAWKLARLVLIPKGVKPPDEPSLYRPICLLDVLGKLLEHLLRGRLRTEIAKLGSLSERQFGAREGRSNLDAVQLVVDRTWQATAGSHRTRKLWALIALDVKNTFNSATWRKVIEALRRRDIPPYLMRIIVSYLSERKIKVTAEEGVEELLMTCGVSQGSILGPDL